MKQIVVVLALLCSTSLYADIFETDQSKLFKAGETAEKSGIVFELKNKAKQPIWIALANGGGLISNRVMRVNAGQAVALSSREVNLKLYTELAVWDSDPSDSLGIHQSAAITYEPSGSNRGYKAFRPRPEVVFSFPLNKTQYVTFDQYKDLRPQTGPLGGMLGKTDTGLSLINNVKKDDIGHVPR